VALFANTGPQFISRHGSPDARRFERQERERIRIDLLEKDHEKLLHADPWKTMFLKLKIFSKWN
jgi:hypothetical protein